MGSNPTATAKCDVAEPRLLVFRDAVRVTAGTPGSRVRDSARLAGPDGDEGDLVVGILRPHPAEQLVAHASIAGPCRCAGSRVRDPFADPGVTY